MLSHEFIPVGFQVITEVPDLQIRYHTPKRGSFFIVLFLLLPFVALFIGYLSMAGGLLYIAFKSGITVAWQLLEPVLGNSPGGMVLLFIGTFILLAAVTSVFFWLVWGKVEFQSARNAFILKKQLWFYSWEQQILRSEIQAFEQIEDLSEDNNVPTWRLNLIIRGDDLDTWNEVRSRHLAIFSSTRMEDTAWLGQRLADFYRVTFER